MISNFTKGGPSRPIGNLIKGRSHRGRMEMKYKTPKHYYSNTKYKYFIFKMDDGKMTPLAIRRCIGYNQGILRRRSSGRKKMIGILKYNS